MESLEVKKQEAIERAKRILKQYQDSETDMKNFTVLLMGLYGSGKTTFITTGVKPILIDSFDPRGTVGIELAYADEIKKGNLVIRKWWDETSDRPHVFRDWEQEWMKDVETGTLSLFGTYAIDSMTTFIDALANEVAKRQGRRDRQLAIQDYGVIYNTLKNILKVTSAQDTNFVLTAHLVNEQDELTGEIRAEIDTFKRLKSQVPLLFTEKYVIDVKQTSQGLKRIILTETRGRYRASSQLALKGLVKPEEEPNLKNIMKKAGLDVTDKPSLLER